jgi:hypothetical protein
VYDGGDTDDVPALSGVKAIDPAASRVHSADVLVRA